MSSGVDLTTGGSGTGGGGAGGMDILTKLAASMEALTNAIVSKFSGNGGQNATLKNNLKQDALSNLEDRLSLLFQRMSDGRKVTQGNIDSYDTLIKRLEKFKDANPSVIQGFKDHLASITAISEAQKALTALNKYYAQISKDQQIKDNKALATLKQQNKLTNTTTTTILRMMQATKLSQGSLYKLEDQIKRLAEVSPDTAEAFKNFELPLLQQMFKNQEDDAQKEKDKKKTASTAKKATTKQEKIDDIIASLDTSYKRFMKTLIPSQKGIYAVEDKLKKLSKTLPQVAEEFKNTKLAEMVKKQEAYNTKLTQTAKENEYKTALKNYNKSKRLAQEYFTELMSGATITDKSIRKFEKLRSTVHGLTNIFNEASTAAFGKKAKKYDVSKVLDFTQQSTGQLKVKQAGNEALKEKQSIDAKIKKSEDAKQKALAEAFDRNTKKWKALKDQIDLLGPSFTLGAKSAAKLFNELMQYRTEAVSRGATKKPFEDVFKTVTTKLKEAKDKQPETKSVVAKSSSVVGMIGKNIMNSITGALTSGIAGPILSILGMVAAPFKDFIDMIVNTIGVVIKWVLVATGLLGWLKRLELSLAAFNARMDFSSDRMLSLDTAVQRAATGITKSVYELGSSVVSAVDNALMNPLTGFADIVNKISKFVGLVNPGLMEQYNRVMDNLMALIGSALQPVVIEITNLMYEFGVQLKPMIEMLGGYLAKALRALAMSLIPLIPQLIMGLTQLAGALIGYVAQMGVNIAEGGVSADREERIKAETERLNIIGGTESTKRGFGRGPENEAIKAAQYTNRAIATKTVDKEIKAELDAQQKNPPSDFMDMAVAKNAKFTSGMEMGKSSIQKAFEASSAYGVPGQSQDDQLKQAQLEFYTDPTAWVKKAMGIMGAPPQVTGGGGGGSADGSHLNPLQKLELAKRVVNAGTGSAKTIVSAVTLGIF